MKSLKWLAAVMAAALAGCGGGGGDGGGSNELRIGTISPSVVTGSFTNLAPMAGRNVALSASYSGTLSGNLLIVVEDADAVFAGAFLRMGANSTVILDLQVSDTAPVGRYTQPLRLNACLDATCTRQLGGFPRTIPKDVTITGTTVGTTSLTFNTSAGVAGTAQHVIVTPPNGADFTVDPSSFLEYTDPNGNSSTRTLGEVFFTAKTPTGFSIVPRALWPGRYRGAVQVATPGYATRQVLVEVQVAEAAGPVVTLLTPSGSAVSTVGASADVAIDVDVVRNLTPVNGGHIAIEFPDGTSPIQQLWLRFWEGTDFTPPVGAVNSGRRLRFYANACFLGSDCLAAGTHTATIVYTATAYNVSTTVRVPVTFTVQ
jgi:hypothetical protein